jgi:protein SCO1/2
MRMFRNSTIIAVLLAIVWPLALAAQQPAKGKSFTLRGKVEQVSQDRLTVNHERVEGYMAAMTMPYKVDTPDVLKSVKVGDQIEATVYADDYTLYNVKVVPPAKGKQK